VGRTSSVLRRTVEITLGLAVVASSFVLVVKDVTQREPESGAGPNKNAPEPPPPSTPLSIADAVVNGSPTAPVVVIEYASFECGRCAEFGVSTLHSLEHVYFDSGRASLVFRELPIGEGSARAFKAAAAAVCSGRAGKFLQMQDLLFEYFGRLDDTTILRLADSLRLDKAEFTTCLNSGATSAAVTHDIGEATDLGIFEVPTFLVGARLRDGRVQVSSRLSGAVSLDMLRREIDNQLSLALPRVR
jgi:protein-disulfide isomerase